MTQFVLYNIENGVMYGICETKNLAERAKELYGNNKLYIREVVYLSEDFIEFAENKKKVREQ